MIGRQESIVLMHADLSRRLRSIQRNPNGKLDAFVLVLASIS